MAALPQNATGKILKDANLRKHAARLKQNPTAITLGFN